MRCRTPLAWTGAACLAMLFLPGIVRAQPRGPARPPTVSPFLSIGPNSNPQNYLTIVRPTLETRAVEKRQQAEMSQLEQRLGKSASDAATPGSQFEGRLQKTGHRVFYQNTSHYFPRTKLSP